MSKPERDRYEVAPTPRRDIAAGRRPWRLTRNREVLAWADTQREVIETAVLLARHRLAERGQTAELVIKGTDGKIRDARTYGDDPRSIRG